MALSLRLGNIKGKSVEDVLREAVRRRDKTITWLNPDWPILPRFSHRVNKLEVERPIRTSVVDRVLTKAGQLVGIIGQLKPHDLRRGAAYDATNAKQEVAGIVTVAVARSLGQTRKALDHGTTDQYVKSSYHDYWSHRVEQPIEPPRFDLEIARAPYVAPRLSPNKIIELYLQQFLDPSDTRVRQNVSNSHRKELFNQWVKANPGSDPYKEPHTASMSATLRNINHLKRPHAVAVGENPLVIAQQSSSKRGRQDGPGRSNIYDNDESDGKASRCTHDETGETLTHPAMIDTEDSWIDPSA